MEKANNIRNIMIKLIILIRLNIFIGKGISDKITGTLVNGGPVYKGIDSYYDNRLK